MFFVNGMNEAEKAAGCEVQDSNPWPVSLLSFPIMLFRRGIRLVLVVCFFYSILSFHYGLKSEDTESTAGLSCTSLMNLAPPKALPCVQSNSLGLGMWIGARCRMLSHTFLYQY